MNTGREQKLLLRLIDEAFDKKSWHGTNLRGSIREISFSEAVRRPAKNRHNIWEIVLHCAYWKYAVRRRILGEKRGSFPIQGSNWFKRPGGAGEKSWREEIKLLAEVHNKMRLAVAEMKASDLEKIPPGSTVSNLTTVSGIAFHDIYHAGQIQLIKRLIKK